MPAWRKFDPYGVPCGAASAAGMLFIPGADDGEAAAGARAIGKGCRDCSGAASLPPPASCCPAARGRFAYTTQGQLAQAWTATDNWAATPTPASHATVGDGLGTASAYDETWTFNSLGEPATKTAFVASASGFANTTYGYSATQPTALTSAATTGVATSSSTFGYNADGRRPPAARPWVTRPWPGTTWGT
jgi:hypothetical protein